LLLYNKLKKQTVRPVVVLEEPGQTEDDRGGGNDDDVAVRSLDRAQSLRVKWSTHGDVAVHRQQHLYNHLVFSFLRTLATWHCLH